MGCDLFSSPFQRVFTLFFFLWAYYLEALFLGFLFTFSRRRTSTKTEVERLSSALFLRLSKVRLKEDCSNLVSWNGGGLDLAQTTLDPQNLFFFFPYKMKTSKKHSKKGLEDGKDLDRGDGNRFSPPRLNCLV